MRPEYRELIESRSSPEPNTGCWIWAGSMQKSGYGDLRINYKHEYAHRLSYEAFNGDIPLGYQVMHKCDNRFCVNPDHLSVGTNNDNIQDSVRKGRRKGVGRSRPHGLVYKSTIYPIEVRQKIWDALQIERVGLRVANILGVPVSLVYRVRDEGVEK